MDGARITAIAEGVTVQARTAADVDVPAGDWREIEENGVVNDGEEIEVEADEAKYDFAACVIQKRTAAAWADAETVTLDLPSGTSHVRRDRMTVTGDEANSGVALTTISKGDRNLQKLLSQLKREEKGRFTLEDGTTRYRCIADAIARGNRGELGGFEQDFSGTIIANREQFEESGETPTRGMQITLAGQTYRIVTVRTDEIAYSIDIDSVNR